MKITFEQRQDIISFINKYGDQYKDILFEELDLINTKHSKYKLTTIICLLAKNENFIKEVIQYYCGNKKSTPFIRSCFGLVDFETLSFSYKEIPIENLIIRELLITNNISPIKRYIQSETKKTKLVGIVSFIKKTHLFTDYSDDMIVVMLQNMGVSFLT